MSPFSAGVLDGVCRQFSVNCLGLRGVRNRPNLILRNRMFCEIFLSGIWQDTQAYVRETEHVAKIRVYEIAKELGVESRTILDLLQSMGESTRSASSIVDPAFVGRLRSLADVLPSAEALRTVAGKLLTATNESLGQAVRVAKSPGRGTAEGRGGATGVEFCVHELPVGAGQCAVCEPRQHQQPGGPGSVYATRYGKNYHTSPSCDWIKSGHAFAEQHNRSTHPANPMTLGAADQMGLTPCEHCFG